VSVNHTISIMFIININISISEIIHVIDQIISEPELINILTYLQINNPGISVCIDCC